MRRISAIGLIAAMIGQPALGATLDSPELSGPIARSARAEASRLAAEPEMQSVPVGWRAVRGIEAGSSIEITTSTGTVTRVFVAADDSSLTVLRLALPGLTEQSKKHLTKLAAANPSAFVNAAAGMGGLFLGSYLAAGIISASCSGYRSSCDWCFRSCWLRPSVLRLQPDMDRGAPAVV